LALAILVLDGLAVAVQSGCRALDRDGVAEAVGEGHLR
jgi:hypothetical protein